MASGITTNTTQADIDIKVVVPELNAALNVPGVTPNTELSLISNDSSLGLITSVTNPELVTSSSTPELATTENIVTTNITLNKADIDIKVLVSELNAALNVPGVTPNTELSLISNDSSLGLITSITNPELVARSNIPELTTTENIVATNITLGKFARGLESLNLKNPIYNKLGKLLSDTSIFADFFNRRVQYLREITDPVKSTALDVRFFVNKTTVDKTALQDLLNTLITRGRSFIDRSNLIDTKFNYSLSTNYTDVTTLSESAKLTLRFIRNITGQEVLVVSDLKINKRIGISTISNNTVSEALIKTVKVNLIEPKYTSDTYYRYSMLKLLTDSFNNTVKIAITPYKQVNENLVLQDTYNQIWYSFRKVLETKTFSEVMRFYSSVSKYDTSNILENLAKKLSIPTSDFTQIIDLFNRQVNYKRIVIDLLNATDDYYGLANIDDDQYVGFYKQTRDFLLTKEELIKAVAATLVNIAGISDTFSRVASYNRIFAEAANRYDIINKNPKLIKSEVVLKQDYYSRIVNFYRAVSEKPRLIQQKLLYIGKYSIEAPITTADKKSLLYSFISQEIVRNTDIFNRQVDYIRKITDYISTTDDYYGLANIDDDQYAGFYKQSRDYLTFQEFRPIKNVNITTTQSIADISDPYVSVAVFNRTFTNSTNRSDTISKNPKLIKSEIILKQDYYSRVANFYRVITDAQNLIEEKVFYASSYTINIFNVIDRNSLLINKPANAENITSTDTRYTITRFIRNILDSINATDDYYGLANIDDDQYVRFNKGIVDTVSFAEKLTPVSFKFYSPIAEFYTTNQQLRIFIRKFPSIDIVDTNSTEYTSIKVNKYANNEIFYKYDESNSYFNKVLQDTIKFTDFAIVKMRFGQLFSETLTTNNTSIKLNTKKLIKDKYTIIDYLKYTGSVKFTDIFNKTEKITLKVTLSRIDSTQFAETFIYNKYSAAPSRIFTDQIVTSNSGTINNQDYFADKYVAPGYAGTNRTIF